MNYEKPATGIMKQSEIVGENLYSVTYLVSCNCTSPDDSITFSVDAEDSFISVSHYVKVKSKWWAGDDRLYVLRQFWMRLKQTYRLWVNGYVEYEASTLLDQQQAYNYANTLIKAVSDAERFKKQRYEKNIRERVQPNDTQSQSNTL